jgi:DNA-binding SARP family transcriptional activator
MLTVGLLGPVELRRDGERIALPGGKTTELLVRLALEAGRTVRSERLIDDLWGDEGVGTAKNTLQSKVSACRTGIHVARRRRQRRGVPGEFCCAGIVPRRNTGGHR